jgi:hypothetical protein
MFSPNCVVLLPFSEIAIKGNVVRGFMEKKLKKNICSYLGHYNADYKEIISTAGRMIIHSKEPQKIVSSLEKCFGISAFFLAKETEYSSLEDLCIQVAELCKSKVESGTFAVRGRSFAKAFGSKKLNEELGGALLDAYPQLKVKLVDPQHEVFCIAFEKKAYFYFEKIAGANGMPVGTQGRAGLLLTKESEKKDLIKMGKNLLKTGCALALISDGEKDFDLSELMEYNSFKALKVHSIEEAKELYSLEDIRAFFSTAKTIKQAEVDSKLIGVKVFAPQLF